MRILKFFSLVLILSCASFAQVAPEILQFKARIGFSQNDERIIAWKFFEGDDKLVIVGRKSVQFWDVPNAKLLQSFAHEIPNPDKGNLSVGISPNGQSAILYGFGKDKGQEASVWNLQTGKQIAVLKSLANKSIRRAFWSDNGQTLITLSNLSSFDSKSTEVIFWNTADFKNPKSIVKDNLMWFYLSRDGEKFALATASKNEGYTQVWNTKTAEIVQNIPVVLEFSNNYVSPDEKFFGASKNGKVSIWEFGGSGLPKYEIASNEKNYSLRFPGFSFDGKYLFVTQYKGFDIKAQEIYDAENGKLKAAFPISKYYEQVELAPDGETLFLMQCRQVEAVDLASRQKLYQVKLVCKRSFDGAYADFDILRFHPNGKLLLTFSDKTVRVFNVRNGTLAQTIVDPNRAENKRRDENKDDGLGWSAGWLKNGDFLFASGADGKTILLWELKK